MILGVPNIKDCLYGTVFTFLNLIYFFLIYFLDGFASYRVLFALFLSVVFIQTFIFLYYSKNIFIIFRYSLLSVMPVGMIFAFILNVYSANFHSEYQTVDATYEMVAAAILALFGTSLGWFLPFSTRSYEFEDNKTYMIIGYSLLFFVVYLFFLRAGGIAGSGNIYAEQSSSSNVNIGTGALNSIMYFFVGLILIYTNIYKNKFIYILPIIVLLPVLTGSRADFLMQGPLLLISIIFIKFNVKTINLKIVFLLMFVSVTAYLLSNYIGAWRNNNVSNHSLIDERNAGSVLVLSTANQMIGTLYAVFGKLNISNESTYLLGSSYLDYILRTVPSFMDFERPLSMAYYMNIYGRNMAQGGIFEVSEAYWNFGIYGAFIVPFLITIYLKFMLTSKIFNILNPKLGVIVFLASSLMSPRAIWYQSFVYWRVLTVVVLFCVMIYIIKIIFTIYQRRLVDNEKNIT